MKRSAVSVAALIAVVSMPGGDQRGDARTACRNRRRQVPGRLAAGIWALPR